ncbi:hypothetical protein EMG21_28225, partial [Klebsiella pneumoniae]
MKYQGLIVLFILTLFISACSSNTEQSHQSHSFNGDLQEKTTSTDVLPAFLKGHSEEIGLVYQAAG